MNRFKEQSRTNVFNQSVNLGRKIHSEIYFIINITYFKRFSTSKAKLL